MVTITPTERAVRTLSTALDDRALTLTARARYYAGEQPLAYLAKGDAEALHGRLLRLPVNYCRHAVDTLADRLTVEGFATSGGGNAPDLALWQLWRRLGLVQSSDAAHRLALVAGRCPVSVWSDPAGGARVRVEHPGQTIVTYDPATGERAAALKRWHEGGRGRAVLYTPEAVTMLTTVSTVPAGSLLPADGWVVTKVLGNALGVVPVVELIPRGGISEQADLEPLVDALTKVMSDAMVSAEFGARPRRFTLGVEITEDENGNPVNPFVDGPGRVWQLEGEKATATVGQLDGMSLAPYSDLASVLTHQLAALAALPPHLAGIRQDQPASAEALRAAESALSARARTRQRAMGPAWGEVIALAHAAESGQAAPAAVEVLWNDPETASPAQAADAVTKLVSAGILTVDGALDRLGYSPEQIEAERNRRNTATATTATADVAARAALAQRLQSEQGLSQPAALAAAGLFAAAAETRTTPAPSPIA